MAGGLLEEQRRVYQGSERQVQWSRRYLSHVRFGGGVSLNVALD